MFESMFQPVDKAPVEPYSGSRTPRVTEQEAMVGVALDFTLDTSLDNVQATNEAAAVLTEWYASHSVVRRLWAIEADEALRVILTLEPTADGDDTQPTWLANSWNWTRELRFRMQRMVHLELIADPSQFESPPDRSGALITEVFWRDPTVIE